MNNTHKRATKKIISYILIFFLHWIPIVIQNLGRFLKVSIVYNDNINII